MVSVVSVVVGVVVMLVVVEFIVCAAVVVGRGVVCWGLLVFVGQGLQRICVTG